MIKHENIIRHLTFSPFVLLVATWGMLFIVGTADHLIRANFNLFIFYLIPIAILTLNKGVRSGIVMSVVGACLWLILEKMVGRSHMSSLVPYWNAFMRLLLFMGTAWLVHYWSASNALARTDAMTGLHNRRSLQDAADLEMRRASRYSRPLSVAFIDLDNLKSVNDRMGHKAGDQMIKSLANMITKSIRNTDVAARMGGDEFVILMPETDAVHSRLVMSRIQAELKKQGAPMPGVPLTASVGLATFIRMPKLVNELIERSDRLMYEAKKSGKNCLKAAIFPTPAAEVIMATSEVMRSTPLSYSL